MKNGKIILEPFKPVTVKIGREIIKETLEEEGKMEEKKVASIFERV